jgi:mannosyltransferase
MSTLIHSHLNDERSANTYLTFIALAVIMALAAFLRIHELGSHSLWNDELMSVSYARSDGFWERLLRSTTTINMAFYYVVLHFWVMLGQSDFWVRLPSVIFGLLAIPAIYALGSHLFDKKVGLIAALLIAVHALHIEYSQEARSYSLVVLFAILSSLFFTRGIRRSTPGNWIGYIIFSVLGVYTHVFGVLVILAHASSLPFVLRRRVPWMGLVFSMATIGLMLIPIGWFTLTYSNAVDWVSPLSLEGVHKFWIGFTGSNGNILLVAYLIPVAVAFGLAVREWTSGGDTDTSWKYGFLVTWLVVPISLALVYSILAKPMFVGRFLLVAFPALILLAAAGIAYIAEAGIARIRLSAWARVPLLALVLLVALVSLAAQGTTQYYDIKDEDGEEDWRGVNQYVMSQWKPGDAMLFYTPWMDRNFEWYNWMWSSANDYALLAVPKDEWENMVREDGETPSTEELVEGISDDHRRVWLVLSHAGSGEREDTAESIESALEGLYQERHAREFEAIDVVLFGKPGSIPAAMKSADPTPVPPLASPPGSNPSLQPIPIGQPWEAETGVLTAPMEEVSSSDASEGAFIVQTSPSGTGAAEYLVEIQQAGRYEIKAKVQTDDSNGDALQVQWNGLPPVVWELGSPHSTWTWVMGPDTDLAMGQHRLVILHHEANTRVDLLELRLRKPAS